MRFKFSQILFIARSFPFAFSKYNEYMHDFIVFIANMTLFCTQQDLNMCDSDFLSHGESLPSEVTLYMIIIFTLCCQNNNLVCR